MWMGFVPLFCKTVGLSTGLPTIKKNMICGERSSFGDFFSLTIYGIILQDVYRKQLVKKDKMDLEAENLVKSS